MINVERLTKGDKQVNDISPMKWAFLKESCTRTLHFAEKKSFIFGLATFRSTPKGAEVNGAVQREQSQTRLKLCRASEQS